MQRLMPRNDLHVAKHAPVLMSWVGTCGQYLHGSVEATSISGLQGKKSAYRREREQFIASRTLSMGSNVSRGLVQEDHSVTWFTIP